MANLEVMYSSKTDQWATPQEFFVFFYKEFHIHLDPSPADVDHKCDCSFTRQQHGLLQDWGGVPGILQSSIWQRNWRLGAEML